MNRSQTVRCAVAVVICSMAVVFASASPASACSCAGPMDAIQRGGDSYAAVFVGEVADQKITGDGEFGGEELDLLFDVETVYRGVLAQQTVVSSYTDDGGNCGFSGAGRILVFAYLDDDRRLATDGCSVSNLSAEIDDALLAEFGESVSPEPGPGGGELTTSRSVSESNSHFPWSIVGGAAFAMAMVGGFGLMLRGDRIKD